MRGCLVRPQNPLGRNGFLTTLSNNPSTTSSSPRKELKVHMSNVFVYNIPAKISSICWLMAHCLHAPALSCGRNSGNILVFLWQSRVAASAGRKYINQLKHHKIHHVFAGRHSEPANFISNICNNCAMGPVWHAARQYKQGRDF